MPWAVAGDASGGRALVRQAGDAGEPAPAGLPGPLRPGAGGAEAGALAAAAEDDLSEASALAVKEEREKLGGRQDLKATPWVRRLMFVGFGIAIVQQITGVNTIMYYGTQILTAAGFTSDSALTADIADGVISVLATFVGSWLLGRVRRRPRLMTSQIGTTVALLLVGVFSLTLTAGDGRAYAVQAMTVTFLAFQQGAIPSSSSWWRLSSRSPS